jgi:hypothetical protein
MEWRSLCSYQIGISTLARLARLIVPLLAVRQKLG